MAKIEEKVEQLVKDPIEKLGYSLYDVEYVKEGPEYYLRIYIDKESGIDLNDCEKVSNEINEILDKADYIKEQYYLEVSSPGIERKLRKDCIQIAIQCDSTETGIAVGWHEDWLCNLQP